MRISDWSSDVCSSDLREHQCARTARRQVARLWLAGARDRRARSCRAACRLRRRAGAARPAAVPDRRPPQGPGRQFHARPGRLAPWRAERRAIFPGDPRTRRGDGPMSAPVPLFDCRDAYVRAVEDLAAADPRIVAVVNDSVGSSKLGKFRDRFPERLVNVGIAEQNMVGVGAALANGGKIPFVSGASCFLTARAMEQIRSDCAYSFANVKLCGISSGVAYGELGATHHSIEDIAWLRAIDRPAVIVPADPWETAEATKAAAGYDGPVYVRIRRMPVPELARERTRFAIGQGETLREGGGIGRAHV